MSTEKLTVLVADSRLILKTFSRILGENYTVIEASDGDEEANIGTIDPVTQLGNKPFFLTRGDQMASFANRHHSAISLLRQAFRHTSVGKYHAFD